MSHQYYKCKYYTVIDPYGNTETRYVYGHYQGSTDTWGFKDCDGSTLINLCFEDSQYYNKLDAIIDIYKGDNRCITITKEEYENPEN